MDQWSKPHLIKNGIRIQCNTENFVPVVVPGLSNSSSRSDSSTSRTLLRQGVIATSSSSSSSSPTTTASSDSENREREDQSGIDSPPVPVSSSNVEEMIERGDPLFAANPGSSAKPTKNLINKRGRPRFRTGRPVKLRNSGVAARIQRKSCG